MSLRMFLSGTCSRLINVSHRFMSTSVSKQPDVEGLFLDARVRYLLRHLTTYDPLKVFSRKAVENLESPKYRFMTDEQLKDEISNADARAVQLLQMPPVKKPSVREPEIIEEDMALQGFLDPSLKVVFLDATPGFTDTERLIVVRQADGVLREADRDERHRTNQIFYPVEERHMDMPPMFQEPYFTNMLNRGAYKLALDNVCLHLEPYDQEYISLSQKVYEHISVKGSFDCLLCTRHYGPMVYHYVVHHQADPLLLHLIHQDKLDQVHALLRLFYIIHPGEQVTPEIVESFHPEQLKMNIVQVHHNRLQSMSPSLERQAINLLKTYIEHDASSLAIKPRLQLAWQKLEDNANKSSLQASN